MNDNKRPMGFHEIDGKTISIAFRFYARHYDYGFPKSDPFSHIPLAKALRGLS